MRAGEVAEGSGAEQPSGLREYGLVLWHKKLTIIIVTVLAVGGMLAYCKTATKKYTANATVLLEPTISADLTQANTPNALAGLVNVPDVIQIIESSTISNIVAKTIPNPPSVTVTQLGTATTDDTVQLSVTSSNAQTAAAAANAYATSYITYEKGIATAIFKSAAKQLQNKVATLQVAIAGVTNQIRSSPAGTSVSASEVELSDLQNQLTNLEDSLQEYDFYGTQGRSTEVGQLITSATAPTKPSSPKTVEYTLFALIFGVILGIGIALLVNAVSREDELERSSGRVRREPPPTLRVN